MYFWHFYAQKLAVFTITHYKYSLQNVPSDVYSRDGSSYLGWPSSTSSKTESGDFLMKPDPGTLIDTGLAV